LQDGRGDRSEGPRIEARRAESEGGILGEGAASPLPPARGLGECCKLSSGVRGKALAAKWFLSHLSTETLQWC